MFKPGQIWDRTHRSGKTQIGLILKVDKYECLTYIIDGARAGEYYDWSKLQMRTALLEDRLVLLA